jgi:hypothetical protein
MSASIFYGKTILSKWQKRILYVVFAVYSIIVMLEIISIIQEASFHNLFSDLILPIFVLSSTYSLLFTKKNKNCFIEIGNEYIKWKFLFHYKEEFMPWSEISTIEIHETNIRIIRKNSFAKQVKLKSSFVADDCIKIINAITQQALQLNIKLNEADNTVAA